MSSVGTGPPRGTRPTYKPLARSPPLGVVVTAFMEVLDTTIANGHCATSPAEVGGAQIESEWVITAYLDANATSCR